LYTIVCARIASVRDTRDLSIMFDSPLVSLFILAVLVFVGWYAIGTQYNVRLGSNAMKWLQQGLPLVGEKAALRWLGSSVVELKMVKAKPPFRSAEVLVVMEPRDVPVIWLWGHAQGRRDLLIFRAQLRATPDFELEARGEKIWNATAFKPNAGDKWTVVPGQLTNAMRAAYKGTLSSADINQLLQRVARDGMTLTRLAVHRSLPNLEVHFLLPKFENVAPMRVFSSLQQLSEEILKS
jgi:hypothetical protein